MSFATALALTLLVAVFVLACTMANLLARIARLERFAREVLSRPAPAPVRLAGTAGPAELPAGVAADVAALAGGDEAHLLFVSPDCGACDEAVETVARWPEEVRRATVLVYRDEPPADFVAPAGVRVAPGGEALFRALAVTAMPSFVGVRGGVVAERTVGVPGDPGRAGAARDDVGALSSGPGGRRP